MENIFKLLVGRLIIKTEELFKQVKQKPMMSDNYLFSVVFINFEKIKPKKNLNSETYIQIMLLYVMGWLEEYMDEVQDKKIQKSMYNIFTLLVLQVLSWRSTNSNRE